MQRCKVSSRLEAPLFPRLFLLEHNSLRLYRFIYRTARELFGLHRVGIQRRDGGNRGWHTFVADKARQVSRGGGSLPVIGGEMRVEFEPLCRELKLNARPPSNHLTSSIHLRFFHGNLFPMEGDALRGRNNRLLLPRISSLSSLFFLFSPSFFRFGSKSESESRETRRNIFFFLLILDWFERQYLFIVIDLF